jgi:hypothetical protein
VRWRLGARYDLEEGQALPFRSEFDVGPLPVGDLHLDTMHNARTGTTERVVFDWRFTWGPAVFAIGSLFDQGNVSVGTPFSPGAVLATGTGTRTQFHTFGLALGPWRGLSLTHRTYYDHEDGRRVESDYGMHFQGRCWLAEVSYVNLPAHNLVRFRIGLVGPPESNVAPEEVSKPLFGPLMAAPSALGPAVP